MKKKILLFLVLFSTSIMFAENSEYTKLYEEGQKYETEENWFHAAISYMNAVNEDPVNSEESYTRLNMILNAFRQGKPGFSEYDEFSYRDLWIDIFKTAEKYFLENPPYKVVIFPLEKGELNYEDKTATFKFKIFMSKSDAYSVVANAISKGSQYAIKPDWGFPEYFDWPKESVTGALKFDVNDSRSYFLAPENKTPKTFLIDNIPTSPGYAIERFSYSIDYTLLATDPSKFICFGSIYNSLFNASDYILEIALKNENGENILSQNTKVNMGSMPQEISIKGISNKYFKDIEKGKIKPEIEKVSLEYGNIDYAKKHESDFMDLNPKNIDVIYSGFPTTIKESPLFIYSECLLKLAQKGRELEQQIVKNPILPETIIGLSIPEKPVLNYPDIGPEPVMEAAPKDLFPWEKKKNKQMREEKYQKEIEEYNLKLKESREKVEEEYNVKLAEYEKAVQILEEKKATDPRLKYNWYYVLIANDVDYRPMETRETETLVPTPRNQDALSAAVLNYKLITDINNEIYIYNGNQHYNSNILTVRCPYKDTFDFFFTGGGDLLPRLDFYSSDNFCQFFMKDNYNSIAYRGASPYEIDKLKIPQEYTMGGDYLIPVTPEGKPCHVLIISEPIEE